MKILSEDEIQYLMCRLERGRTFDPGEFINAVLALARDSYRQKIFMSRKEFRQAYKNLLVKGMIWKDQDTHNIKIIPNDASEEASCKA